MSEIHSADLQRGVSDQAFRLARVQAVVRALATGFDGEVFRGVDLRDLFDGLDEQLGAIRADLHGLADATLERGPTLRAVPSADRTEDRE